MAQFAHWFSFARQVGLPLPHAMTLATVHDGLPAARMLLLTAHDEHGFVFCTDSASAKVQQLSQEPRAALVFHWPGLERQVRAEGTVSRADDALADAAFARRAWGARLAAWAGGQSQPVAARAELEARLAELARTHETRPVERPPGYCAYRLAPHMLEFWQGRDDWLHDRLRYTAIASGWRVERLAP